METKAENRGAETEESLAERGVSCAKILLERKGYDIIETGWECPEGAVDLIAVDDEALVFVDVQTRTDSFPDTVRTDGSRRRRESIAARYLSAFDGPDMRVRFDDVHIMALGHDRAFARHVVNSLSGE